VNRESVRIAACCSPAWNQVINAKYFWTESQFKEWRLTAPKVHFSDKKGQYECSDCQKLFAEEEELKEHAADVAHQESFVCPNSSCREMFGTFSALLLHVEIWKLLRYLSHNIARSDDRNDDMIDAEKHLQAAQTANE
jgi:hypothetical protein